MIPEKIRQGEVTLQEVLARPTTGNPIRTWSGILDLKSGGAVEALSRVVHEQDYYLFSEIKDPELLFMDVGANCGQTICSLRAAGCGARIVAFEPDPFLSGHLQAVVNAYEHVTYQPFGLGEWPETLTFWIPVIGDLLVTPLGTTHPETLTEPAMERWLLEMAKGDVISYLPIRIPIKDGDGLGLSPFWIKVDTEGHETQCLSGLAKTIQRCRPGLMIERSDPRAIDQILERFGYGTFQFGAKERMLYQFSVSRTQDPAIPLNIIGLPLERAASLATNLGVSLRPLP